ncbi:transposase, partial [Candidatus Kaiserbacteria bacterium]|nr:transposase [Candidatus Kaiserbacteria bacterium]
MQVNRAAVNGSRPMMTQEPDVQVVPKAKRRRFSAEYKRQILSEADRCSEPGQIGALLRREGLYSSHLTTWRRQREQGALGQKRGRKPDPQATEIKRLEQENERLRTRLS